MAEHTSEDVETLTKRFKAYIDKVQMTLKKVEPVLPELKVSESDSADKFYTVVSPADVMASNLKSVLGVLEKAIENIDSIAGTSPEKQLKFFDVSVKTGKDKLSDAEMGNTVFSQAELEFLEKTFNKILNSSRKERNRIFEDFDKISKLENK